MQCQRCSAELTPGAEVCRVCGAGVRLRCPACQNIYSPGNRFCGNCGQNLAAGAAASGAADDLPSPDRSSLQSPAAPSREPSAAPAGENDPAQAERASAPPRVCPHCHQVNEAEAAYCEMCGRSFIAGQGGPATTSSPRTSLAAFALGAPGGFGLRFLAYLIDSLVVAVPLVLGWVALGQPVPSEFAQILNPPPGYERLQFLVMIAALLYDTLLIGYLATTAGKRAFGLYVVRSDGSRVGFGRALARHLLTAISANFTFGFIFLVVAIRQDRRGLHDLLCDTVVIRRQRNRD